jgi:hypothetical protein
MAEQNGKFITVILPQGKGPALLEALYERKALRASLGTARAPFFVTKTKRGFTRTIHHSVEKDILTVVVDAQEAEEVFGFIHEKAGMGSRFGGFMFMGPVAKASLFTLPADMPQSG